MRIARNVAIPRYRPGRYGAGRRWLAGALGFALTVAMAPAGADIYKYVDKYGRVYLTDTPDHGGYKRLVKTWKGWRESRVNYRALDANRKRFSSALWRGRWERTPSRTPSRATWSRTSDSRTRRR